MGGGWKEGGRRRVARRRVKHVGGGEKENGKENGKVKLRGNASMNASKVRHLLSIASYGSNPIDSARASPS